MPGIAQKISNSNDDCDETNTNYQNPLVRNGTLPYNPLCGSSASSNGFWSKHQGDMSFKQLQKFWYDLTPKARQSLLRVGKQTLFEHARKNMYCSRCNGLLLEGFLQIVMYGKSLQQDAAGSHPGGGDTNNLKNGDLCTANEYQTDVLDPSVHPWGGLSTSKDGMLTLVDCFLYSKSLKGLQKVFDSARARERERKLLYPDACGGGGRGWISQGMAGYSRGHGTRETCALHTARLAVETLIDFWSALGEETQQSLLRMKEEDFIERLMFRFDSKRFCRDCRRNVIREFKELKELKRMRREPRCTSWFCAADTAFQYEVSDDTVQADWHQSFLDAFGTYHHFEWAIGTGEGKSDILEFENVGLSGRVQMSGLDLSGMNACYITLRAWKMDGRCNELCVKAHALRGQQCLHCRLVVGDGYVTITVGENIRRFFEHAEEAEEEEDDDSVDKDGNEFDGECSRPQKHAKNPELAREFLLDAATVIFKEQVEKAFREGTARQNAHSIFVCLALKLLEQRLHVACKEIITLEKQMRLLEEEEKEKREEEERKERRRTKEKEKKLRRKERLREKENKEKKCAEANTDPVVPDISKELPPCVDEGANVERSRDSVSETDEATPANPLSPNIYFEATPGGESGNTRDWKTSIPYDHLKYSRRKLHKDTHQDLTLKWYDRRTGAALLENEVFARKYESRLHADAFESSGSINGFNKHLRTNAAKYNARNGCSKLNEKVQRVSNGIGDRYDSQTCSCNHHNEYRSRPESHITRAVRESKYKFESPSDISKPYYRGKYTQVKCTHEINERAKNNIGAGYSPNTKKVWEPLDSQKRYAQSNSGSDVTLRSTPKVETSEADQLPKSSAAASSGEVIDNSVQTDNVSNDMKDLTRCSTENCREIENGFHSMAKSQNYSKVVAAKDGELCSVSRSSEMTVDSLISSSFNFDNYYSCPSEGDSNTSSSNTQNLESASVSDSEESTQNSEGRETSHFLESRFTECHSVVEDQCTTKGQHAKSQGPASGETNSLGSLPTEAVTCCENVRVNVTECHSVVEDQRTTKGQDAKSQGPASGGTNLLGSLLTEAATYCESVRVNVSISAQHQSVLPQLHNQNIHYPVVQTPTVGYYHPSPVSWPAPPANGLMSFPYSNHYLFANTFGYDLNSSARFIRYGALQHLPPQLLNPLHVPMPVPVPVFPPVTQANVYHSIQKVTSAEQHSVETPKVVDARENKSDKTDNGNNSFSLFHFGGPVALSADFIADPVPSKDGMGDKSFMNLSDDGNHSCNRKDSIEEYNLFAASNGIKFSIF